MSELSPRFRSASATILVVLCGLILTAAFVNQHRRELIGLPAAALALGGAIHRYGVLGASGLVQTLAGVAAALLVVTAWYGVGNLVRGAIHHVLVPADPGRPRAAAAEFALTCALGAGTWSLAWLGLGLLQLYRPGVALGALAGGLALAAWRVVLTPPRLAAGRRVHAAAAPPRVPGDRATRREEAHEHLGRVAPATPHEREWAGLAHTAAVLTGLPVALALVGALAPPTAKDALQYHLALPKAFVAGGGIVDVPGNIASYFALGGETNGLSAMLVGRLVSERAGEAAFGAAMFAFFPLLLAAVFGWARESGVARAWSWLAASMVAGVPAIAEVAASSYVDLALALYVAIAIRSGGRWWRTADRATLAESALALGFALSVKLTAAFLVPVFALFVLVRSRRCAGDTARRVALAGLAALVAIIVVGSPWYVRNWIRTGSPVFPFFASVWPGHAPGWNVERSAMLVGFNALYGGDKRLVGYALTPLSVSLTGQREVAAGYEGVLGASFLIGAVLIVWALARRALDPELTVAAASGALFFVWWVASAQVLRYLVPALPPLAVATAGAGSAVPATGAGRRAIAAVLMLSIAAAELLTITWFAADDPLLAATGAEPRAAYLERRLDYYAYYRVINESLPRDARVWLIDVRRDTYHLERAYAGDYLFEDYTLRQWIEQAASGEEVQQRAAAAGITHVLIRHDILLDAARSPLVDDGQPPAENQARLERLRSFLTDGTRVLRADRKFALIALPRAPR